MKLSEYAILMSPDEVSRLVTTVDSSYLSVAPEFRFRRTRDLVEDPNSTLLELLNAPGQFPDWPENIALRTVREKLEEWWTGEKYPSLRDAAKGAAGNIIKGDKNYARWVHGKDPNVDGGKAVLTENDIVIKATPPKGGSAQYYLVKGTPTLPVLLPTLPLDNPSAAETSYIDFWQKVVSLERVGPSADPLPISQAETIDLTVGAIIERYASIDAERRALVLAIAELEKRLAAPGSQSPLAIVDEIRTASARKAALERLVSGLQAAAVEKGYELVTEPEDTRKVKPGQLYQKFSYVERWVEAVQRSKTKGGLFGSRRKTWTEYHDRSKNVTEYRQVLSTDSEISRYIKASLSDYNVRILHLTPKGYVTNDNMPVTEILALCEADSAFRAKCALLVPEYNQTLYGRDVVVAYRVVRGPQRGRVMGGLPRIQLEEHISYRMRWRGCELGELTSSIALMPGEERTINIKTVRSSLRESEIRSTSVAEIDSSNSTDAVSSVENEFQKENSSERTLSWSARGSASGDGYSGGGDASGTSRKSSKEFARTLNKLTNQAVSKMRRATRQEVVARALDRTEAQNTLDSAGRINNPNVGRTLNINFFQVNNVYVSGTTLTDLEILYRSPFELIDGTGIQEIRYYRLSEIDRFWRDFEADVAAIVGGVLRAQQMKLSEVEAETPKRVAAIKDKVFSALRATVTEYDESQTTETTGVPAFVIGDKDGLVSISGVTPEEFERLIAQLYSTGVVIERSVISAPSGALYADSLLGQVEGLEPYAVDLRRLEVERALTEILQARHRMGAPVPADQRRVFDNISFTRQGNQLEVTLGGTLEDGEWQLMLDGFAIGRISVEKGKKTYKIELPPGSLPEPWPNSASAILVRPSSA